MKTDNAQVFSFVLYAWNEFASVNGYTKKKKLNNKETRKVQSRIRCEPDYLVRLQSEWDLIRRFCPKNEWGNPSDFYHFLRPSMLLMAIYRSERKKDG